MLEQALRLQADLPPELLSMWRADAEIPASSTDTVAFACNQRDEVRDLHDVAVALGAQPGMKQQTFVASFSAGAGASAGSIGYEIECSPTLKASESGNMAPSILCLNDQGGQHMDVSEDITGTIRAQTHGHPPIVMATQQGGAEISENLCPTITASAGMSGNNQPVVLPETYTISGPAIDRQPHNGGNGLGVQREISPALTTCDRPAVFSQQRSNQYRQNEVACTQSARQYKDATDLVVSGIDARNLRGNGDISGTLQAKGEGGFSLNYVGPIRIGNLVRRLTPLECERLMGFPDGWTAPGSDSKRYRALGNSVAIPCVEYIMMGIAAAYEAGDATC